MERRTERLILISVWLLSIEACSPSDRALDNPPEADEAVTATCSLLIQNVNVVDVVDSLVRENIDVCIDGTTIAALENHAVSKFEANILVSGDERFLIPGLNDMHVHFRGGEESVDENRDLLTLYLTHGITGVYDQGTDISNDLAAWRKQIREGELTGPDLYMTGPKIDGPDPWFPGSLIIETRDDAESVLEQLAALEVDGVKIMGGTLSVDAFWFALDAAVAQDLKSIAHVPPSVSATEAAERGLDAVAHLSAVAYDGASGSGEIRERLITSEISSPEAMAEFVSNFDHAIMRQALERIEKTNTALITTYYGIWLMAGGLADESTDWERAHYRYAGPLIRNSVEKGFVNGREFAQAHQQIFQALRSHLDWILSEIEKTEILLLVGSDSGPRNSIPGRVLHREMELLVSSGLSPAYVLRAATYNPAIFLGLTHRAGSVEKGRVANLVLLEANPLVEILNIERIDGVIKSGRYLSKSDIDDMLRALETKYAN